MRRDEMRLDDAWEWIDDLFGFYLNYLTLHSSTRRKWTMERHPLSFGVLVV